MNPNNYILNSDFGSLKNDSQANTISVALTDGLVFNPNNSIIATTTMTVGTINAGIRARGNSSKYSGWVVGTTLYSDILINDPAPITGGTGTANLYCWLERISSTQVKLYTGTETTSGAAPNYTVKENQTITFVFSTFLSPFD